MGRPAGLSHFKRCYIETTPTAPGGGRMRWTVEVEEPMRGCITPLIHVTEDTTLDSEKDCLLLDTVAACKLRDFLSDAIEHAIRLQTIAGAHLEEEV